MIKRKRHHSLKIYNSANIIKIVFAPILLISLLISSCGGIESLHGKELHEKYDKFSLPVLENFSSWSPIWNKGAWVVTLREKIGEPRMAQKQLFDSVFANMMNVLRLEQNSAAYLEFGSMLQNELKVELVLPTQKDFELNTGYETMGFALVKLNNFTSAGGFFQKFDWLNAQFGYDDFLQNIAFWQMSALQRLPQSVWVEPDLQSHLFTENIEPNAAPKIPLATFKLPGEFVGSSSTIDAFRRIRADRAYKYVTESLNITPAEVNVAVLDTGVDYEHPDLKDQMFVNPNPNNDGNDYPNDIHGIDATIEAGKPDLTTPPVPGAADLGGPGKACPSANLDKDLSKNCGHGTHVAGIIAAKHGEDLRTLGVCPNCKIISLRVSERCLMPATRDKGECIKPTGPFKNGEYEVDGGISDSSQIRALTYLFNLRRPNQTLYTNVVNMSLGKYFRSRAMSYIIRNLENKSVVIVAAAGNENTDTPSYPAAYSTVVSVCATGDKIHSGEYGKASFSNFGDWVDICAPGWEIRSTLPGLDESGLPAIGPKSGTSQATPFVAGAIGYMLSLTNSSRSAAQIVTSLKKASNFDKLYNAEFNVNRYLACYADRSACDYLLGSGFLDLEAAVQVPIKPQSPVDDVQGRQVKGGCVVSAIGFDNKHSYWSLASSLPFLLIASFLFFKAIRKFRGN